MKKFKNNSQHRSTKKTFILFVIAVSIFISALEIIAGLSDSNALQQYVIPLKEQVRNFVKKFPRPKEVFPAEGIAVLRTDSEGFILTNRTGKPLSAQKKILLVFLGGSTTECFWVLEELRWPYLLSQKIATDANTEVICLNAGTSGNNTHHNLNVLLNKIAEKKPNIVFLMEAVNDAALLCKTGTYSPAAIEPKTGGMFDEITRSSHFLTLVRNLRAKKLAQKQFREILKLCLERPDFYIPENKLSPNAAKKITELFRIRIRMFIEMTRAINATPVLLTQPINRELPVPYFVPDSGKPTFVDGLTTMSLFNQTIREEAGLRTSVVIDMERLFPKNKDYFYDWVHYTDAGSMRFAQILYFELYKNQITRKALGLTTPLPSSTD